MSSSLIKVNCYLNIYLKERIFAFIEHDTWLINKKHAQKALLLRKIIPVVHVKLYWIYTNYHQKELYHN